MQVYGFLEKAQLENVSSDLANTLAGLVWFNTTDSRSRFYDGSAVRTVVDENSTQTLINKILTGNQMANFSPDGVETITAPAVTGNMLVDQHQLTYMDALHQTTPAAPAAGGVRIYSKNDNLLYKLDSEGNEVAIGTGGGGLDVFHIEDFEVNNAADFSTGNNATFLGGGVLAGTLTDVNTIAGNRNIRYTQAAGSLNDYFASPAFDIDPKQAGNTAGVTLYFKYDGDADDIKLAVYDATNNALISKNLDLIPVADNPTRFSTSVSIPQGVTSLRWGAQVRTENIGAILEIDDCEFTLDPFVYKNLFKEVFAKAIISDDNSVGSQKVLSFSSAADDENDLVNVGSNRFDIKKTGLYDLRLYGSTGFGAGNWATFGYRVNGGAIQNLHGLTPSSSAGDNEDGGRKVRLNAGDYVEVTIQTGTSNNVVNMFAELYAIESTEHVVTPAVGSGVVQKILGSDITGTGLIPSMQFTDLEIGEEYEVTGQVQGDTGNNGWKVQFLNNGNTVGNASFSGSTGTSPSVSTLVPQAVSFKFTAEATTMDFNVTSFGNVIQGNGTKDETYIQVQKINAEFLAAVPVQKTAYINPTSNYISSVSGTTGYKTIPMLNVTGDSEIVSINSNQMTLAKGKYEIVFPVGGYNSTSVVDALIYNITDSQNYEEFLNASFHGGGTSTAYALTDVKTTIEIASTKTFELRTKSLTGIGAELFGRIKITKIK